MKLWREALDAIKLKGVSRARNCLFKPFHRYQPRTSVGVYLYNIHKTVRRGGRRLNILTGTNDVIMQ